MKNTTVKIYSMLSKISIKIICFLLIFLVTIQVNFIQYASAEEGENIQTTIISRIDEIKTYNEYISEYTNNEGEKVTIIVNNLNVTDKAIVFSAIDGKYNCIDLSRDKRVVDFEFYVSQSGLYNMELEYYAPLDSTSTEIGLDIKVNGNYPFIESSTLSLSKSYKNETENIKVDENGNQIRPQQLETPRWLKAIPFDKTGFNSNPFLYYFQKGSNKISLNCNYGLIVLNQINLSSPAPKIEYKDYIDNCRTNGFTDTTKQNIYLNAENANYKSSPVIYPKSDRDDAITSPSDPVHIRLNTISSDEPGQKIMYKFQIDKSGLYNINLRVRQNQNRGMTSTRRIYIDGKIPFEELNNIEFRYDKNWYIETLGGNDPFEIYFEQGEHTIDFESNTGNFASTLITVQNAIYDLNVILRKIVMVTGVEPDPFRDYDFSVEIPDLIEKFIDVRNKLSNEVTRLNKKTDFSGSEINTIEDIIRQIDSFIKEPRTIPSRLESFRGNISSLSTWILKIKNQYLEMDYITINSKDIKKGQQRASLIQQLEYNFKAFIASFVDDYNIKETSKDKVLINVWLNTGRDQSNIIKSMLTDDFYKKNKTAVNLTLVDTGTTLLQAVLANKGPDVAMFVTEDIPVNLAARNALIDMNRFEGFNELQERFYSSAFTPFIFNSKCYAVPNSQTFNMMFYRTDIFEELNIIPPKTWNEFYNILPVIQRNNMQVGASGESQLVFESLVLQNRGEYYKEGFSETNFNSIEVLDAFKMWTGFYTKYQLPLTYDFFNRFRTGEMPLAIMPYTQYNLLSVAAPEIRGLWAMTTIPGVRHEDNQINISESATGTGSIIIKNSKNPKEAFEFLDWWSSNDSQVRYANDLESTMGPAARYDAANKNILERLRWQPDEAKVIREQWERVIDIEMIPSTYYTTRNISNAFREVIYKYSNEREVLNKFNKIINAEIKRKNTELQKYNKSK